MSWIHDEMRKLWNVGYDPNEVRWCVFGTDPDGKVEWIETTSREYADRLLEAGEEEGHSLEMALFTRDEIRNIFGEPEFTHYSDSEGNPCFTVLDGDGVFGIVNPFLVGD